MSERRLTPITFKRIVMGILMMIFFGLALVAFIAVEVVYWPDAGFFLTLGRSRAEVVREYGRPTSEDEKEITYATVLNVIKLRLNESGRVSAVQIVSQD